jgi:GGDEF domain-containing protein
MLPSGGVTRPPLSGAGPLSLTGITPGNDSLRLAGSPGGGGTGQAGPQGAGPYRRPDSHAATPVQRPELGNMSGPPQGGGSGPAGNFDLASALDAELQRSYRDLTANPVTPSVRNEQFLTDAIMLQQGGGRDVAVLLADSNNFSTYNRLTSQTQGDVAIDLTSQAVNRVADRLNGIHSADGINFVGGRKGGDEMAIVGYLDPAVAGTRTRIPDSVATDMVRIFQEELPSYNARNSMPIPTGTSSATVLHPGEYNTPAQLGALLDRVDHAGVELFNTGQPAAGGSIWNKNAGAVILSDGTTRIIPGPTYQLDGNTQSLLDFRANQGGLADPAYDYARNAPNVAVATVMPVPAGEQAAGPVYFARPQLLPGAGPGADIAPVLPGTGMIRQMTETDLLPLDALSNPGAALWRDPERGNSVIDTLINAVNDARAATPLESTMRYLAPEGINVYSQPVAIGIEGAGAGLGRIDSMITVARNTGGSVTLEYIEPRGLKEVNDTGFIMLNGQRTAVAHSGGNVVIEQMVRSTHAALSEVLGPNYENAGLASISRDRGKRFAVAYGSGVTPAQRQQVVARRDEIYSQTPAQIITPDGQAHALMLGSPDGSSHNFRFSMAHAAVEVDTSLNPAATAQSLRDSLVMPVNDRTTSSLLDLAKDAADGNSRVPSSVIPTDVPGIRYSISPHNPSPANASGNRTFDKAPVSNGVTEVEIHRLDRGPATGH